MKKRFQVIEGGRDDIERAFIESIFRGECDRDLAAALDARQPDLTVIKSPGDAPPCAPEAPRR